MISVYRKRHEDLVNSFKMERYFVACTDIHGLMQTLNINHICEWDSRARSFHYSRKYWPRRKSLEPGIMNVENQSLVEPSKILLPSMNLKLGLMKKFVKAMNQRETAFTYL